MECKGRESHFDSVSVTGGFPKPSKADAPTSMAPFVYLKVKVKIEKKSGGGVRQKPTAGQAKRVHLQRDTRWDNVFSNWGDGKHRRQTGAKASRRGLLGSDLIQNKEKRGTAAFCGKISERRGGNTSVVEGSGEARGKKIQGLKIS